MIGEGELQREARRVLRKLVAENTALVRLDDGRFTVARNGRPDRARTRVEPGIVSGMRTRDWIRPLGTAPESFALSAAGAAWLGRTLADGDPFAAQHRIARHKLVVDAEGIERLVAVNEAESPLARLRARNMLDAVQFGAGERLRRDYTLARLAPRLGVDLAAPVALGTRGKKEASLSDTVLAAKQRFSRAMKAVGPGLNDLLFDVCCHLIGIEEAERDNGWPMRAGRVVLAIALDRLAAHYGLVVTAPSHGRLRSWQTE
jgi:hypothetical protein